MSSPRKTTMRPAAKRPRRPRAVAAFTVNGGELAGFRVEALDRTHVRTVDTWKVDHVYEFHASQWWKVRDDGRRAIYAVTLGSTLHRLLTRASAMVAK
jgi:hypothetical protein